MNSNPPPIQSPSSEPTEPNIEARPSGKAQLILDIGFFPLGFFLYLCKPTYEINGHVQPASWGKHQLELPPGEYNVKVYFGYLFMPQCGANSVTFHAEPDATYCIKFYMWPWMLMAGSMNIQQL